MNLCSDKLQNIWFEKCSINGMWLGVHLILLLSSFWVNGNFENIMGEISCIAGSIKVDDEKFKESQNLFKKI